jgi:hypothetical protein
MQDLGFKIVKTNGGDELLARIGNYEICKAAFEKAIFVYPNDHLEMRQGARVILKSRERYECGKPNVQTLHRGPPPKVHSQGQGLNAQQCQPWTELANRT